MIVGSYEPHCSEKKTSNYTKKNFTHFATKSSKIIICSRRACSTLQKRSLQRRKKTKGKRKIKKHIFFFVF
jgi:hypothetical protein